MLDNTGWTIATGLVLLVCFGFAYLLEQNRRRHGPQAQTFIWGFFYGLIGFVGHSISFLLFLTALVTNGSCDDCYFLAISTLALATSHYMLLTRTKLGWIAGSLGSLNFVVWIINFYYGRKRWHELSDAGLEYFDFIDWSDVWQRVIVLSGLAYITLVVLVMMVFQPFGERPNDVQMFFVAKIALLPPIAVGALYLGLKTLLHAKKPNSGNRRTLGAGVDGSFTFGLRGLLSDRIGSGTGRDR